MKKALLTLATAISITATLQAQNVGVGTNDPKSKLDVSGGISIGDSYAGTTAAPADGAIIQGQVGIGTATPDAAAALDVTSTTKGAYIPRLTTIQKNTLKNSLTGSNKGLLVFDTDLNRMDYWNGTAWKPVGDGVGDVTLAPIGSSPNIHGATLSGQQLNLQPADATHGGVVSTSAQSFAGNKRIIGNADVLSLEGTDHSYIQWFPDGNSAGRKAWTGFGTPTDNNFTVANEVNGAHIVLAPSGSGNVGIGTASPGTKLDVVGGSIRTDNQIISTVATGTAPLAVNSTTLTPNLNADMLDGRHLSEVQFYQSSRDFPDGTLIKTDIDYSVTSGDPWLLEIEGNSYWQYVPIDLKVQGYIYYDSLINTGGISNGTNITGLSAFNYNGYLCFWFPYQTYWNGYNVFINDSYQGVKRNRLVSITNEAKPVSISKEVELSSKIRQSWHSGNFTPGNYSSGNGTQNYVTKFTSSSTIGNSQIYDNGTNVGIGTTDPQTLLNINLGAGNATYGTAALRIGGTGNYPSLELGIKGNYDGMISTFGNDLHLYAGNWRNTSASATENHNLWFYTSRSGSTDWNTAKMVLDYNGNLGIGTTSPQARLDVNGQLVGGIGAATTAGTSDWNDVTNTRSGSGYTLLTGNATNGPYASGDYFHPFNFEYSSKNGSGNITQLAVPYGNSSSMDKGIWMRGRYSGSWTNWMKIISENSSGNVGVGTVAPSYKMHVEYTGASISLYVNNSNGSGTAICGNNPNSVYPATGWAIFANGDLAYTGGSYGPSDKRLKKSIKDYTGALSSIEKLHPKTYYFDKEKYPGAGFSNDLQYGFVAQELKEIFPTLVKEKRLIGVDSVQNFEVVNYVSLIPVLTQAIKEQQEQINKMETNNQALQQQITTLTKEVEGLKRKN